MIRDRRQDWLFSRAPTRRFLAWKNFSYLLLWLSYIWAFLCASLLLTIQWLWRFLATTAILLLPCNVIVRGFGWRVGTSNAILLIYICFIAIQISFNFKVAIIQLRAIHKYIPHPIVITIAAEILHITTLLMKKTGLGPRLWSIYNCNTKSFCRNIFTRYYMWTLAKSKSRLVEPDRSKTHAHMIFIPI